MTTQHNVVEDDQLGKVTRRALELLKRVHAGQLSAEQVADDLQLMIEGQSIEGLGPERRPFIVSLKKYSVMANYDQPIVHVVPIVGLNFPASCGEQTRERRENQFGADDSNLRCEVQLVEFNRNYSPAAAAARLEAEGYEPADIWQLCAFFDVAPMCVTGHSTDISIFALGSNWEASGNVYTPHIRCSQFSKPRWEIDALISCHLRSEGSHKRYVLVNCPESK